MKITWLGQAGFLFENEKVKIMIDPYLSDSVKKVNPKNFRRQPVREEFFDIKPNILIFTHNHLDHYDPETAERFINDLSAITVLSPTSVYAVARKLGGNNNFVLFNEGTSWTEKGIRFTAVRAEHSDPTPIGVIIDDGERKYYVTGDTLYNEKIFEKIPSDIFALFLPINGVGNNMNIIDAIRFSEKINPEIAVPIHFGMFDELDANLFEYKNKIIPEIYKEIKFI